MALAELLEWFGLEGTAVTLLIAAWYGHEFLGVGRKLSSYARAFLVLLVVGAVGAVVGVIELHPGVLVDLVKWAWDVLAGFV